MSERLVTLLLALSMVCAGSNVVTGKMLAGTVDVFTIGLLSLGLAFLVLIPFQVRRRDELRRLSRSDLLHIGLQSAFGIVLYRVMTLIGLGFAQAVDAAIILSTTPAAITILAIVFLRERPTLRRLIAVALAVAAALVVNLSNSAGERGPAAERLLGNLLILGAVLAEALMTIFRRHSGTRVSHVTNTTLIAGFGFAFFLIVAAVRGVSLDGVSARTLPIIAIMGLFGTAIGYLLWGYGAARVPASTTGVVLGVLPLSAIVLGVLILGEPFTTANFVGAALGLSGFMIATTAHRH